MALQRPSPTEWPRLSELRESLTKLTCVTTLQWVPGHCGLIGNEWADHEANRAAGRGEQDPWEMEASTEPPREEISLSWSSARAILRQYLLIPNANHPRVQRVYGLSLDDVNTLSEQPLDKRMTRWREALENLPFGSRIFPPIRQPDSFGRQEAVLLSQLRAGHCRHLAAYCRIVNPLADPVCPRCREEPEEVEHWLRKCPAITSERTKMFGFRPPLCRF